MYFDKVTQIVHGDVQVFKQRVFRVETQINQVLLHLFLLVLQELRNDHNRFFFVGHILTFLDFFRNEVLFGSFQGFFLSVRLDVLLLHVLNELRGYLCECLASQRYVSFFAIEPVQSDEIHNVPFASVPRSGFEQCFIRVQFLD